MQGGAQRVRRSQGQMLVARSLWYVKPGVAELRTERLGLPRPGEARVKTLFSGISRGTERLVAYGRIPASERDTMRAPLQAGGFPFPVKYGYSAVGEVTAGPDELLGKTVFCLHPHQDHFHAPAGMLIEVPSSVGARRAVLAANMETALNAHWDAGTMPGDKIAVIGAGIVGLLTAYLAARIPGTRTVIADIDPAKGALAEALGLAFTEPAELGSDHRIVFNTSASGAGLQAALAASAFEGLVVEMSWYGDAPVTLQLGGAFHARRLRIIASQVGHVAPAQRATATHRDRLARALALLADSALDGLVSGDIAFDACAAAIPELLQDLSRPVMPVIRYAD